VRTTVARKWIYYAFDIPITQYIPQDVTWVGYTGKGIMLKKTSGDTRARVP